MRFVTQDQSSVLKKFQPYFGETSGPIIVHSSRDGQITTKAVRLRSKRVARAVFGAINSFIYFEVLLRRGASKASKDLQTILGFGNDAALAGGRTIDGVVPTPGRGGDKFKDTTASVLAGRLVFEVDHAPPSLDSCLASKKFVGSPETPLDRSGPASVIPKVSHLNGEKEGKPVHRQKLPHTIGIPGPIDEMRDTHSVSPSRASARRIPYPPIELMESLPHLPSSDRPHSRRSPSPPLHPQITLIDATILDDPPRTAQDATENSLHLSIPQTHDSGFGRASTGRLPDSGDRGLASKAELNVLLVGTKVEVKTVSAEESFAAASRRARKPRLPARTADPTPSGGGSERRRTLRGVIVEEEEDPEGEEGAEEGDDGGESHDESSHDVRRVRVRRTSSRSFVWPTLHREDPVSETPIENIDGVDDVIRRYTQIIERRARRIRGEPSPPPTPPPLPPTPQPKLLIEPQNDQLLQVPKVQIHESGTSLELAEAGAESSMLVSDDAYQSVPFGNMHVDMSEAATSSSSPVDPMDVDSTLQGDLNKLAASTVEESTLLPLATADVGSAKLIPAPEFSYSTIDYLTEGTDFRPDRSQSSLSMPASVSAVTFSTGPSMQEIPIDQSTSGQSTRLSGEEEFKHSTVNDSVDGGVREDIARSEIGEDQLVPTTPDLVMRHADSFESLSSEESIEDVLKMVRKNMIITSLQAITENRKRKQSMGQSDSQRNSVAGGPEHLPAFPFGKMFVPDTYISSAVIRPKDWILEYDGVPRPETKPEPEPAPLDIVGQAKRPRVESRHRAFEFLLPPTEVVEAELRAAMSDDGGGDDTDIGFLQSSLNTKAVKVRGDIAKEILPSKRIVGRPVSIAGLSNTSSRMAWLPGRARLSLPTRFYQHKHSIPTTPAQSGPESMSPLAHPKPAAVEEEDVEMSFDDMIRTSQALPSYPQLRTPGPMTVVEETLVPEVTSAWVRPDALYTPSPVFGIEQSGLIEEIDGEAPEAMEDSHMPLDTQPPADEPVKIEMMKSTPSLPTTVYVHEIPATEELFPQKEIPHSAPDIYPQEPELERASQAEKSTKVPALSEGDDAQLSVTIVERPKKKKKRHRSRTQSNPVSQTTAIPIRSNEDQPLREVHAESPGRASIYARNSRLSRVASEPAPPPEPEVPQPTEEDPATYYFRKKGATPVVGETEPLVVQSINIRSLTAPSSGTIMSIHEDREGSIALRRNSAVSDAGDATGSPRPATSEVYLSPTAKDFHLSLDPLASHSRSTSTARQPNAQSRGFLELATIDPDMAITGPKTVAHALAARGYPVGGAGPSMYAIIHDHARRKASMSAAELVRYPTLTEPGPLSGASGFAMIIAYENDQEEANNEIEKLTVLIRNASVPIPAYLRRRGILYCRVERYTEALTDLNRAVQYDPFNSDAYWYRHQLHLLFGNIQEALDDLDSITKTNKQHFGAIQGKARIYQELGMIKLAIVNYSQIIKLKPDEPDGYYNRACLFEAENEAVYANEDFKMVRQLDPMNVHAIQNLAVYNFQRQLWEDAISALTKLIQLSPENRVQGYIFRGRSNAYMGKWEEALRMAPDRYEGFFYRASLLRERNPRWALMDYSISILLEDSSLNSEAYYQRALLYYKLGEHSLAIADYCSEYHHAVIELDPTKTSAHLNLGILYMETLDDQEKALVCFNKAILTNPVELRAYLCRGDLHQMMHNMTFVDASDTTAHEKRVRRPRGYAGMSPIDKATADYSRLLLKQG
ncbi:hypothetical protein BDK51DRAFT_37796 [Blyttiomyces helicus]|uniref:Uncharacterized protein n=1 Tax=Blyttiomyces helicus TaxID=388810 RepID=A0A4P9WKT4_9FUNG|nr:hypothetical protein BDK51DRAFT_37796 [Blyttiomyces helicus]|eukprot:RKO91226.1 hypothetical protein BDK51DRAFT_37796 [Blyttiomyces helicus]